MLQNKKATTHWAWHERLAEFGAIAVKKRVVIDGNLFTGGGVTAGIDFGLTVIAKILGEDAAMQIQLGMEYNPMPPFDCGSPKKAPEAMKQHLLGQLRLRDSSI